MKQLVLAALICAVWWMPAQSSDHAPSIRSVISQQIEAFKADDLTGAFRFASNDIRRMFRTPERFGHMVEHGYPMVYRPSAVWFLDLRERDGVLWQRVEIQDKAGSFHILAYEMVETPEGWNDPALS